MLRILPLLTLALWSVNGLANNTGGVFGPLVNPGHESWQYRIAIDEDDRLAQRLHYQKSLNDDLMWRVIGQARKTADRDVDFDYVQAELFWQLPDLRSAWHHGVRFDLRARDAERPHQVGLNWMHQWRLNQRWSARALALTTLQFGDNRRDGVGMQLRASVSRNLSSRGLASLSWFSDYGTTRDGRSSDEQLQQLGPTLELRLGDGWRVQAGALYGLTDGSPDQTYRLWLTKTP